MLYYICNKEGTNVQSNDISTIGKGLLLPSPAPRTNYELLKLLNVYNAAHSVNNMAKSGSGSSCLPLNKTEVHPLEKLLPIAVKNQKYLPLFLAEQFHLYKIEPHLISPHTDGTSVSEI